MKFLIDNWSLILLALVSGGMLAWPRLTGATGGGKVSPAQAVQMMNREKAVLIDVCDPAEFAAGHAKGARNVPLAELKADHASLPKNKATPVVVLCAKGMRAARAAALLQKAGFEKAVALEGGNAAWREAQLPVEKSV